jgi:hypothetical protein
MRAGGKVHEGTLAGMVNGRWLQAKLYACLPRALQRWAGECSVEIKLGRVGGVCMTLVVLGQG